MRYTCARPKPPAPDPCRMPGPCPPQTVPCPPRPCPQPAPAPCCLLPRVIAAGRTWQRRLPLCLTVSGLPECAAGPFTLLSVTAVQGETAFPDPACGCLRPMAHVTVPLVCRVRDGCGCIHAGRGLMETDVCLTPSCPGADPWRSRLLVQPCVRLVMPPCPREEPHFDACVELLLDAWLVRWEPSGPLPVQPACPELPLYPELRCT